MSGKILIALFVVVLLLGWLALPRPEQIPVATQSNQPLPSETRPKPRSLVREVRTRALPPEPEPESAPATNFIASLMAGEAPRLTPAQIETYLEENHRSAESLLAAFRVSGEKKLLQITAQLT